MDLPPTTHSDLTSKGDATIEQVAKDFGVSTSSLHRWLKAADGDSGVQPGAGEVKSVELKELRKRNRPLEQENKIMRKAAAYLVQGVFAK